MERAQALYTVYRKHCGEMPIYCYNRSNMKLTSILLALFLLTSCGGGSAVACDKTVEIGDVEICLIDEWEQVPEEKLRSDKNVPEETVAVFQRSDGDLGENIVITRERVSASVTADAFAQANIKIVAKAPEYAEIEQLEAIHVFSARPIPDLPVRRFYQVSLVKSTTGYVATGTLPFSVDEAAENALITMLKSFSIASQM